MPWKTHGRAVAELDVNAGLPDPRLQACLLSQAASTYQSLSQEKSRPAPPGSPTQTVHSLIIRSLALS